MSSRILSTHHANTAPVGFRPCTPDEFAKRYTRWSSRVQVKFQQLLYTSTNMLLTEAFPDASLPPWVISTTMYRFPDGTGVGISYDYANGDLDSPRGFFWLFGCDHHYREATNEEVSARRAWTLGPYTHYYICEHCGHLDIVDSSD